MIYSDKYSKKWINKWYDKRYTWFNDYNKKVNETYVAYKNFIINWKSTKNLPKVGI